MQRIASNMTREITQTERDYYADEFENSQRNLNWNITNTYQKPVQLLWQNIHGSKGITSKIFGVHFRGNEIPARWNNVGSIKFFAPFIDSFIHHYF